MKKSDLINGPISCVISYLGHTDMVTIADAGLPIPATTQRIDLALKKGVPGFIEVLKIILTEMCVERAIISEDMSKVSPAMYQELKNVLPDIPIEEVSHTEFKKKSGTSRAVIRTGECTPYANVILVAGVWGFDS